MNIPSKIFLSLKKSHFIFFSLFLNNVLLFAQSNPAKHDYITRYTQAQVIDSSEGAIIYNRMMKVLELDYKQLKDLGYNVQGWNEEYFESGQLMHISYYKAGKLVLFKNFYENGQCQHYITYLDSSHCSIEVYFESGAVKHQVLYQNGKPKKITEFYPNGLPKMLIEFDPELDYVISKKLWYLNAETQSELTLTDPKLKKYSDRLFYPNGKIKEVGEVIFSPLTKEYINIATRTSFESSGKKKNSEKYR